jgi:hypothetical protein
MGPLGRAAFRHALAASALVLIAALGAGLVRLLPWLLAEDVPLRVSLPFARALAAASVETAFFVGLPIGFALAAAQAVERGEARALFSLGATPGRIALGTLPVVALLGALALGSTMAWGTDSAAPGRFARELSEHARASCASARRPASALVPMVGVTWLCFPGRPPRVVGAVPGFGGRAWFSARELDPSDDLRGLELADLRIATRKADSMPAIRLHVESASVRGLPGWGPGARLPFRLRAGILVSAGMLLAMAAAFAVLARADGSRLAGLAQGGGAAIGAFAVLHALDRGQAPPMAYFLVPAAGLLALGAAWLAVLVAGRVEARRKA